MKKNYVLVTGLLLSITSLFSQEIAKDTTPNWKKGGSISINFNNTGLVNWSAGGQNSIALGSIVNLYADYNEGNNSWVNSLNWSAGMARVGDSKYLTKKSDDQLILFSKYRKNIKPQWGFAAFGELRTQVFSNPVYVADTNANASKNEIRTDKFTSSFMSPGFLTTSIGWEYNKGEDFYIHATPLAGKGTFVLNDSLSSLGTYGLEPGNKVLYQLGSLVRVGWKTKMMENVDFSTNFMLFSPYKKYGNIDVTWETLTTFKINKFLTTTFSTQLLYLDNARPKIITEEIGGVETEVAKHGVQFKHVLNIGFLAKF